MQKITIEHIACAAGVAGLIALATVVALRSELQTPIEDWQFVSLFALCCSVPLTASWRQAIREKRLPALPLGLPKHQHINGWGFLTLAFAVATIVVIARWAAPGTAGGRQILSSWGELVVVGLAVFFVVAALAPSAPEPPSALKAATKVVDRLVSPFGRVLSMVDSMLVFAVAAAAGANRETTSVRYALLFGTLLPCMALGYLLEPPWGLAPLATAFVVAIAISRRWAWIEDDRELSMLNRRYTGSHLRVGFGQDLRDEALLSFMSMFILVPLALRQVQDWTAVTGTPLFHVDRAVSLRDWIAFFGTELAKAVPFVDWAEIYEVGGNAPIEPRSATARHVVFGTRILVDLVFLAALLQAIGISTRNSKQKELFFVAKVLDRLDPFVEQKEFRKLTSKDDDGNLIPSEELIARFPKYDSIRLGELSDQKRHPELSIVARALRRVQGEASPEDIHEELMRRAMTARPDPAGIQETISAIRTAGPTRVVADLDQARKAMNNKAHLNDLRLDVMRLLSEAPRTPERTDAMVDAVRGEHRDAIAPVRRIALTKLLEDALRGNVLARETLTWAGTNEVQTLRRFVKRENGDELPPEG